MKRRIALWVAVVGAMAALAPAAGATINPVAVTLSPSSAAAGSTGNLGTDITFTPSSGDSTKDLTLQLPPGLLANAAVDGGACLKSTTPVAACQVGSGTVTANILGGVLPVALPATFDLVAPASQADLAGLAVLVTAPGGQPTQLGTPAAVTIRRPADPDGVGLDIAFANIPNTFDGLPLQLHEINSTFNGLRFPDTCPAAPVSVTVTADSYDTATPTTGAAPLTVTGCGAEPYAPGLSVSVTEDAHDSGVTVTTDVTQTADQAPSRSVSLAFPGNALLPNLGVAGALCANPASGTCTPVGAAAAATPLYPTPLLANAYLTGSLTAPSLTLVFGPPFAQTLVGQVSLATNATTFTGLPDFPLTDLKVKLDGGTKSVFDATCKPPSGSATASLTSQNGDQTKQAVAPFTISPCRLSTSSQPSSGGTKPRVVGASASGLTTGKPSLVFQVVAGRNAGKLSMLTVELPHGLRFTRHRVHGALRLQGLSLAGARVKSAAIKGGHLVIRLRGAVGNVIVHLSRRALAESGSLKSQARHRKLKRLKLIVLVKDSGGRQTKVPVQIRSLHLPKK
ncbi:MAG TPA: hypothetical protein VNV17_17255 [Solirubrobacteraceae bacterium]|nr:hypothetical protein [Solirubrobacteraceae bacterium]